MKKPLVELYGWFGVIAIITGYALMSFSYLEPGSLTYFLLNVFGGSGLILSAYPKQAYQPIVLNGIWIGIAIISFFNFF